MIRLILLSLAALFFAASCSPAPESTPGPAVYIEPSK